MRKVVITCGLIAGAIVSALMGITVAMCSSNPDMDHSMLLGYATMLLAFSMIFVGIKMFRDKYNGGIVSFGKAFRVGLYIALIASTMYVAVWAVEYHYFYPDFMEKYSAHEINKLKASGASPEKINALIKKMSNMGNLYKNPLFFTLFTYVEILPLGLVVSVICALILKKGDRRDQALAA